MGLVALDWWIVALYALRPWPWILVGLASLTVFSPLGSLQAAFRHVPETILGHALAGGARFRVLPVRAGVLDLSVRADIPELERRLASREVRP